MELEELKTMWKKYDSKLDHLEKLNKKLIMETLSRKPQKRIDWMKYQSIYGMIVGPIVLIIALHPIFKIENIDGKFIIGFLLTLSVVIYLIDYSLKSLMALKGINISQDSIIESASKVNNFKSIFNRRHKLIFISFPMVFAGVLFMGWKGFHFNSHTIFFMIGLYVLSICIAYMKGKLHLTRIESLEKEILELKEYEN